jgi:hypothetical protein
MSVEIVKIYKQDVPVLRFIGKKKLTKDIKKYIIELIEV